MQLRLGLSVCVLLKTFAAEPEVDPKDLPRMPATEPVAAVKTFQVREGFRMEVAAAEPNIASPVAISFDEDGRLFVVEMRDYSEHRDEALGRIRRLEDADGDGVFEKSIIFAEGLAWPTAVICYDGGIFVGATPDILFLKDIDGDGKADERKVVFTGFAKGVARVNVQQLMNSFNWGLDNRIHGANGGNGATVEQVASGGPTLALGSRDFSFDPATVTMRAETGGGQHGFSFDDFGRKFVSNNSSHIRMVMYEDRYLRAANWFTMPPGLIDIAREGPAAEVFRLSPEEPWRTIRTRWRVAGQVPGPIEGGGRASGYFTGATGVTIYRGDAYDPSFSGNAFIGDAGGNLVHRKILKENGVAFEAMRPPDELNREFVASKDLWFRPIQFANGPDGCLYVIDMYRETIEHPWSIPPGLKKHIDLDSGRERGRIWRIAPENFSRPPRLQLSKVTTAELVTASDTGNGWQRDTAARLLYQRQDASAAQALEKLLKSARPQTRVQALRALAGLKRLKSEHVAEALRDARPEVVEQALLCAELIVGDYDFERLASAKSARVRHQLAWTAGVVPLDDPARLLAKVVATDPSDPWIRAAALVSAQGTPANLFALLVKNDAFLEREGAVDFLSQLAVKAPDESLEEALKQALEMKNRAAAYQLGAAASRKKNSPKFKQLADEAIASLENAPPPTQAAALALLRYDDPARTKPVFAKAFSRGSVEAFRGLLGNANEAAELLWKNWTTLPTTSRQRSLDLLLNRGEGAKLTIAALKKSKITRGDLTASQTQTLRQHSNPEISRPALEMLGVVNSDRAGVIEKFRPALEKKGDMKVGEKLFVERCAVCHRVAGQGQAVGPDFESVRGNGREYLLTHFLDPNREVNSRFVVYSAELADGDRIDGMLSRETESEVTLRLPNGEERTIERPKIKKLTATALSLMPTGLEEGLNTEGVAGLLEFLMSKR